jgi:phage terminase large subunit-like protein
MHHINTFKELEDQLTTWLPESGESPDRMDGMVWAGTRLLIVE